MICVFDVETIPDTKLIRSVLSLEGEDREVSLLAMKEQEEKLGVASYHFLCIKL